MIIKLGDTVIRGDLVIQVAVRYDLSPTLASVEAEIRADNIMMRQLAVSSVINVNGDDYTILKSSIVKAKSEQGTHRENGVKIIALLTSCYKVSFIRDKAIIKRDSTLLEVYRSVGATISGILNDFVLTRFTCLIGETPTYPITQALQEAGGVIVRINKKIAFKRLYDVFNQVPVMDIPDTANETLSSTFLEHHEVPQYISIDNSGIVIKSTAHNNRKTLYSHNKSDIELLNMSKCLIHVTTTKLPLTANLNAGDIINMQASNKKLVIVTALHVFSTSDQYTKLWLSEVK